MTVQATGHVLARLLTGPKLNQSDAQAPTVDIENLLGIYRLTHTGQSLFSMRISSNVIAQLPSFTPSLDPETRPCFMSSPPTRIPADQQAYLVVLVSTLLIPSFNL